MTCRTCIHVPSRSPRATRTVSRTRSIRGVIHRSSHSSETVWLTSLTLWEPVQVKAATYGRYAAGPPDQAVLERFFFLDDADRDLVAKRRGDAARLRGALRLVPVCHVGAVPAG